MGLSGLQGKQCKREQREPFPFREKFAKIALLGISEIILKNSKEMSKS